MIMTDIAKEKTNKNINVSNYWWEREDLRYSNDILTFSRQDMFELAKGQESPFYVYHLNRVRQNIERIENTLEGIDHKIHYAIKANRYEAVLKTILDQGIAGVDVCSPNELELAIKIGFKEEDINYTGTSISSRDYNTISKYPSIHFNADSLSVIRQIGERKLFKEIGIRINPKLGMGYNESLEYASEEVNKFGIYFDKLEEAFALANQYGIKINCIHFHPGSGYLTPQLETFKLLLNRIKPIIEKYKVGKLNIGGGLGVPQKEGDQELELKKWASLINDFRLSTFDFQLIIEPGDYIVKDAGLLIAEVCYIEEKAGVNFLGVNVGMNVNYEYAYYQMNLEVIPLIRRKSKVESMKSYTIAGNINEPIDLMGENVLLPEMKEGDFIAFYNTGGYGASTASNHCMRGDFKEIVI